MTIEKWAGKCGRSLRFLAVTGCQKVVEAPDSSRDWPFKKVGGSSVESRTTHYLFNLAELVDVFGAEFHAGLDHLQVG